VYALVVFAQYDQAGRNAPWIARTWRSPLIRACGANRREETQAAHAARAAPSSIEKGSSASGRARSVRSESRMRNSPQERQQSAKTFFSTGAPQAPHVSTSSTRRPGMSAAPATGCRAIPAGTTSPGCAISLLPFIRHPPKALARTSLSTDGDPKGRGRFRGVIAPGDVVGGRYLRAR